MDVLKKCVIKSNRKVIGVGLGESKTEAKNLAAQQVCKQLRKHCYTIQVSLVLVYKDIRFSYLFCTLTLCIPSLASLVIHSCFDLLASFIKVQFTIGSGGIGKLQGAAE